MPRILQAMRKSKGKLTGFCTGKRPFYLNALAVVEVVGRGCVSRAVWIYYERFTQCKT